MEIKKMEQVIRIEMEAELPHLSPEGKEAIIRSRIALLRRPERPLLIQIDLGPDAGKKSKENLFE